MCIRDRITPERREQSGETFTHFLECPWAHESTLSLIHIFRGSVPAGSERGLYFNFISV